MFLIGVISVGLASAHSSDYHNVLCRLIVNPRVVLSLFLNSNHQILLYQILPHCTYTDASLSHENVIAVLETADPTDCLYIPSSVISLIIDYCKTSKEQISQLVHYWRSVSPYASWSLLSGRLLWLSEKTALKEAKRFIQREPGKISVT